MQFDKINFSHIRIDDFSIRSVLNMHFAKDDRSSNILRWDLRIYSNRSPSSIEVISVIKFIVNIWIPNYRTLETTQE